MNSKLEISRKIHFCSGHRVLNHESKCSNLHGHNYVAWIHARSTITSDHLDQLGRIIDFGVLKEKIGGWIDKYWDHTTLLFEQDQELLKVSKAMENYKPIFKCPFNPTAENMANYLLKVVCPQLLKNSDVEVHKIILYETENCFAVATLN